MSGISAPWGSSTRYRMCRKIGAGGMGIVYEVEDLERGERVALKTVPSPDAETMYRTKQEFRALADLEHPNLVRLHDLVIEGSACFFTMELIEGHGFLDHTARQGGDIDALGATVRGAQARRYDEARVRDALVQLVRAVRALHDAGKVHRDLKPGNVLVTRDGRVVLLDFGLAAELSASPFQSSASGVVGTAAYMSPEQARADADLSPATDWYAVGVMLYEALTGHLPHTGTFVEVLLGKQRGAPRPPSHFEPTCPPDLDRLCVDLLSIAAEDRPTGDQVLERLGQPVPAASGSRASTASSVEGATRFIGRETELAQLARALSQAEAGATVIALVHGESGMGKTTLVRHFVERELLHAGALVLSGRCFTQESIPYKALDGVIDSLSRHLRGLPADEQTALLPPHVGALARLFPVLRRVKPIAAEFAREEPGEAHPADVRLRAFRCLRDLFAQLAARRRLVLVIDDLQWGDDDSASLLFDLLRPPTAPPLLLLATARSPSGDGAPVIATLSRIASEGHASVHHHVIGVGPLAEAAARQVVAQLLGRPEAVDSPEIQRIAAEARGLPFVLDELARLVLRGGDTSLPKVPGESAAEGLIAARYRALPEAQRRLIGVVAVAQEPVPTAIALRAAGIDEHDRSTIDALRAGRWIRSLTAARQTCFDTLHDRIREVVRAMLDAAAVHELHAALASAFESSENPPVDRLARHLGAIGESARACRYAVRAAQQAATALAFDRAARLYALATEWATPAIRLGFLPEMAVALANAGRAPEAAELHLEIAAQLSGSERLEHRRLAADNYLRSGHIEAALAILNEVAGALGIRMARRSTAALLALLAQRTRLALRGLGYRARPAAALAPQTLARLDTLGTVATALGVADPVRGMIVQGTYLTAALDAGEEERVCRALMVEASVQAILGRDKKAVRIARDITLVAQRLGTASSRLWSEFALGLVAHCAYRFDEAMQHFSRLEHLLPSVPAATGWERTTARLYYYFAAQFYGGAYRTGAGGLEDEIEDARRLNDRHAYASFCSTPLMYLRLAQDRPEDALAELDRALEGWPEHEYYLMHMYVKHSTVIVLSYLKRHDEALAQGLEVFRRSAQAGLHRVSLIRDDGHRVLALLGLKAGRLDLARRHIKVLLRSRHDAVLGNGCMLGASLAMKEGRRDEAHARLVDAVSHFERAHTRASLATARQRLGGLVAGDEGVRLRAQANEWARAEQLVAPGRIYDLICPWP